MSPTFSIFYVIVLLRDVFYSPVSPDKVFLLVILVLYETVLLRFLSLNLTAFRNFLFYYAFLQLLSP